MFQSEVKQLQLQTKKQAVRQKGYSIIELSIALAIISIILVTSLAGVQRVLRSNNVNNDLRNINLLAATVTNLINAQTTTSGITMGNLITLKAFSNFPAIDTANNKVSNAFGGQITVAPNTESVDGSAANTGFVIYSTNIPAEACADYINGMSSISGSIATSNSTSPSTLGALFSTNVVRQNGASKSLSDIATACTVTSANPKITISAFVGKT